MKVVKRFVPEIIAGAVVLASLGAWYYVSFVSAADLQERMNARLASAETMKNYSSANIVIPSTKEGDPAYTDRGPVTKAAIERKREVMDWYKKQAERIQAAVAAGNRRGRVSDDKDRPVPLLNDRPYPNVLPEFRENGFKFMTEYNAAFDNMLARVTFGRDQLPPPTPEASYFFAMPPNDTQTKAEYQEYVKNASVLGKAAGTGANLTASEIRSYEGWTRDKVVARAGSIQTYANANVFVRPAWAVTAEKPPANASVVWEAFVIYWLQDDLVHAITAVNKPQPGKTPNVMNNPIKRLVGIAIGSGADNAAIQQTADASSNSTGAPAIVAQGFAAPLFLTGGGAPSEVGPAARPGARPAAPMAAPAAGLDFNKSMTGRVGSVGFDVTHMKFIVDVNPASLNELINQLYQRNNGYTVLNVQLTTCDPFEMASNGYLYGEVAVVRAEILVEAIFFRDWTDKVMPPTYKSSGATATPTAGPTFGGPPGGMGERGSFRRE